MESQGRQEVGRGGEEKGEKYENEAKKVQKDAIVRQGENNRGGGGGGCQKEEEEVREESRLKDSSGGVSVGVSAKGKVFRTRRRRDPLAENYRGIVAAINRSSDSFREGQKWRCVAEEGEAEQVRTGGPYNYKASRSLEEERRRNSRRRGKSTRRKSRERMAHSKTMEETVVAQQSGCDKENGGGVEPAKGGLARAKGRRLVRQKATNDNDALSPPTGSVNSGIEVVDETASLLNKKEQHLRVAPRGGMPARQWTVDTCTGLKTPMQENVSGSTSGTAYLLRPISRTSILSASSNNNADGSERRPSPSDRSRSPLPRSPVRERIRLGEMTTRSAASSFNRSMDASVSSCDAGAGGGAGSSRALTPAERKERRIYERALMPHLQAGNPNRRRLLKQRTSESAPYQGTMTQAGSAYQLPRQFSNASSNAASGGTTGAPHTGGLTTSFSHQGITLVRGASCSLVDIPTYLGPSVAATGGVEVVDLGRAGIVAAPQSAAAAMAAASRQASERRRKQGSISSGSGRRHPPRQRQKIDLTKKKLSTASASNGGGKEGSGGGGGEDGGAAGEKGAQVRKTQWTVLCVSLTLLTLSVALVGGMLSVGSHYQEMVIARKWEELNRNKSEVAFGLSSSSDRNSLMEPFVIVPIEEGDDYEFESSNSSNSTSNSDGESTEDNSESVDKGSPNQGGKELLPIIFPELIKDSEEIRRLSQLAKRRSGTAGKRRRFIGGRQ